MLQEYVPSYRGPLFDAMKKLGRERNISIEIGAGRANSRQAARSDESDFVVDHWIPQSEIIMLGRRLVLRRKLLRLYRRSDLVIVEQARRNLDVYFALLLFRRKVALWGHGRDFTVTSGSVLRWMQAFLTRRSRWFFGYTPESVEAVEKLGFPDDRTTVLWNTVDTAALRSDLADVSPSDRAVVRGGASHVGLFVGALDASKNLPMLIDAGDVIVRDLPSFILYIAGDGPLKAEMIHAAESRPWLRVVGPKTGADLARLLSSADLMLMPGRVGLVAVDCLVAGLPVVTTNWPLHAPERAYLTEKTSRVAEQTASSFAQEVLRLLCDEATRVAMADSARRSSDVFTIESMARRFVNGIEEAIRA